MTISVVEKMELQLVELQKSDMQIYNLTPCPFALRREYAPDIEPKT
jgi:hypothetical protein